jgi:hypothetical protein
LGIEAFMYFEWMKRKRWLFMLLQILITTAAIVFLGAQWQYLAVFCLSTGFFFGVHYLVIKNIYSNSKSTKIPLLLMMWDVLWMVALVNLLIQKTPSFTPIVIILLPSGNSIAFLAKKYNVGG